MRGCFFLGILVSIPFFSICSVGVISSCVGTCSFGVWLLLLFFMLCYLGFAIVPALKNLFKIS